MTAKRDLLFLFTMLALLMGLANRLVAGWTAPLWFDENFSAVIASQDSFPSLLRWCLHELSGPVYYMTLFLWEKLAGNGDVALRIPGFVFSIAVPSLILWRGHSDRGMRLIWASVSALWIAGFDISTEARPYTLVVLLATGQGIAFMAMIARPTVRAAMLWTSLCALAVLTHYHAAILCGLQGIAYLGCCRARALRTWPALLPLLPMGVWMVFHLPFVLQFATPGAVWYKMLTLDGLWLVPMVIGGAALPGLLLLVSMVVGWSKQAIDAGTGRRDFPYTQSEIAFVTTGILAFVIVIATGFWLPSFTPRYLLPYIPALLFALAITAHRLSAGIAHAGTILIAAMLGWSVQPLIERLRDPLADHRYGFNFEQPAQWIAAGHARRVVVLWDNPTMSISPTSTIAAVTGFFFQRSNAAITVDALPWPDGDTDPNGVLLAAAKRRPASAILWTYDTNVPGTRALRFPQHIQGDPNFRCRDFGRGSITMLACLPRR